MTRRAIAFAALALAGCRRHPAASAPDLGAPRELDEIAALEEARDLAGDRLAALAASPDPRIRERALLALARIAAPESAETARERLSDGEPRARSLAAFALERIGDGEGALAGASEARIEARIATEADPTVRGRLLRALGRIGGAAGEGALRAALTGDQRVADPAIRAEALRALAIYGVRGRTLDASTRSAVTRALGDPDLRCRLAAAQALFRMKPLPAEEEALGVALHDPDPTVRAAAARALGAAADPSPGPLEAALSDADWRVRVEAARALAPHDPAPVIALADPARAGADPERVAVALAAVEALGPHAAARPLPAEPPAPIDDRGAALLRCQWQGLRVRAGADDALIAACAPDAQVEPFRKQMIRATALGDRAAKDPQAFAKLRALARGPDGRVRAAALEALAALPPSPPVAEAVRAELSDEDPGALAAACDAESKLAAAHRAALGDAAAISARLPALDPVHALEARIGCIDALRALEDPRGLPALRALLADDNAAVRTHARDAVTWIVGHAPSTPPGPPPPAPAGPADAGARRTPPGSPAALAGRRVHATIDTARGAITLELFPDEAPRTVAAFVALARGGYFAGLTFHRVAADFVIQGGDPRGDGYGGPDFVLRDEPTPRRFERGTVGIALAGPDTGGSQLFICQADAPHLEGKFTAFARVTDGMSVADRMVVGDPIRAISITIE